MKKIVNVLYARGFNCEEETLEIFRLAGGSPRLVFIDDILSGRIKSTDCDVCADPGGFSYGDHVDPGAVVALRMQEELHRIDEAGIPMIHICNGNQIAVRARLFGNKIAMEQNDSGRFCSHPFVRHRVEKSNCVWTTGMEGMILTFPAAHGFGKYVGDLSSVQTVMTYDGFSPNGGVIAAICSQNGRTIGVMDHPERAPDDEDCLQIFRNGLKAA